ncbi:hypothetical protein L914_14961 [Phytophthora nicotianae]|uniref:Uncharacterized protein n=2 Tax=Phytophthora nicotianae TaxID=4792 RepID=V9EIH9_PHYNI|nr:hypothetical protein F443_15559 [Phytophthora nicotianae P1569]ETL32433.1 hypothetical protein L916_15005 [Phytophthora nicotianae]ETM38840.1 hypothetical protein L914_14961 [Phytophthora nicotianae]
MIAIKNDFHQFGRPVQQRHFAKALRADPSQVIRKRSSWRRRSWMR